MGLYDIKPCNCGSGEDRYPVFDAAGIFCTFACSKCEAKKKSGYDPRIFRDWYDADKPDVEYADDY